MIKFNKFESEIIKIIYQIKNVVNNISFGFKVSNLILSYTSLVNELNILKKFRNFDVNGMCKESDDVLIVEMIKVNN